MREPVLIAFVGVLLLVALVHPGVGVLGYVWFSLMRPDVIAYSKQQYAFYIALVTLIGSVRLLPQVPRLFANPISLTLLVMQIPIFLSVVLAVNPVLSEVGYNRYIRIIMMALVIVLALNTEALLRVLLLVMAGSVGFIAVKFGLFSALAGGVQFTKGYGGMYADSNGLALCMAMAVPLCWYSRGLIPPGLKWARLGLLSCVGFAIITVVGTGSRGNSIALGVIALLIALRSRYRVSALVGLAVLSLPAFYLAGDAYVDRMSTLQDVNAEGSAASRLTFSKAALRMWKDYPLFGVGWGERNYTALIGRYLPGESHVVHNTYVQVLVDSGILTFVLYVALMFGTIFWLQKSARRMRRLRPEWEAFPLTIQGPMIVFAVGSTFYSRGDFEFYYYCVTAAACWYLLERQFLDRLARTPLKVSVPSEPAVPVAASPQPSPARVATRRTPVSSTSLPRR